MVPDDSGVINVRAPRSSSHLLDRHEVRSGRIGNKTVLAHG